MEHSHEVKPHPLPELGLDFHASFKDVTAEVHDVIGGESLAREVRGHIEEEKLTL